MSEWRVYAEDVFFLEVSMSDRMKHESEIVKFKAYQAFHLAEVLEGYGLECPLDDDDASKMFSELLVESLRLLSVEQVEELMEAV